MTVGLVSLVRRRQWARRVLGSVIAAAVGGAIFGILQGTVGSGVMFGVMMIDVLNGPTRWSRRDTS